MSSPAIPGAWPDISTDFQPDSPPPHHLDHVLDFHKRLAVSFSSPILMPSRSPLLGISASASSTGLTVGPQDTTTSLSALADESISTSYSSDSGLENASQSRLSESASVPNAINLYASPKISRNQHAFPTLPSPTEHLTKNLRTSASHLSRQPPPRLTLTVPDHSNSNKNPDTSNTSTSDSPLASPVTPPSPTTPASPGPIIFASPSSSSFSFGTPFPSLNPLSKETADDAFPLPKRPYSNEHVRADADKHIRPDYSSRLDDSYSTVASTWTSPSYRDESPLPSTAARPKKPWHDFAKNNSREASPSPLSGKDKRNISDQHTITPVSRGVLSTIQATNPLSSNRSHTLSLSLTRPAHAPATSSASPNRSPFRSNSTSSPYLTPRPSFPSRSTSPSPARPAKSESESKPEKSTRKRSNSISLLRSISDRSRAKFSRSIHTGDVSIAAVDYAAAQCEAAFVSQTAHDQDAGVTGAEIVVENGITPVVNEVIESVEEVQVTGIDSGENVHQSMVEKMKKLGGKVRKLVRDVRASLPSVGFQSEEGVKVRVEVVNSQDVVTQTSPQMQNSSPRRHSPPVLNKPLPRHKLKSRPPSRPLSLSFPSVTGGNFPGYPFIIPAVHVSSPPSSPTGLSMPTFLSTTATSKYGSPKLSHSPPSSPMSTTAPVESKAHAESKTDVHDNAGGLSGTGGNQLSSSATLKKVKNRPDTERSAEERERLRQRRATFSFSRMSSFWGWDAVQL